MHNSALLYAQRDTIDYKLAYHCAPAIAGLKPANLISLKKPLGQGVKSQLEQLGRPFGARDVFFYRLAECSKRVLILVYHRDLLRRHLAQEQNRVLMRRYGYDPQSPLPQQLRRLADRVRGKEDYPHEIGIFLGYPPEDVEGFIRYGGRGCRLCGYWKVYGDEREAARIFSVYDRAREYFCARVADGEEIYKITYGGIKQ